MLITKSIKEALNVKYVIISVYTRLLWLTVAVLIGSWQLLFPRDRQAVSDNITEDLLSYAAWKLFSQRVYG